MSCSSKLIEHKKGVVGISGLYRQLVRSTGNNLGVQLASEVESSLVGLCAYPVNSDAVSGYVGSELS